MEITKDTTIEEIIEKCPKSLEIFKKYNITVFICGEVVWDTIGGVCEKNAINFEKISEEIKNLCQTQ
jgi:iron-sulfur cluster repair protein YtfE (RIC family)